MRKCNRCGETRPLSFFNSHRWCRPCQRLYLHQRDYLKKYRDRKREERLRVSSFIPDATHKWCKECNSIKKLDCFNRRSASKSGFATYCRECAKQKTAAFFANTVGGAYKYAKRYTEKNRGKVNALNASRKVWRRKMAVPPWADMDQIQRAYREAEKRTKETGIKHEVDHVIPLRSPVVCGLHVETNLRVITRSENIKKRNRYQPLWMNSREQD